MAWKMNAAKRRALVALQLRDKHGRFIDMGKGVKWFSPQHKMEVSGVVEDGEGTSAIVRMSSGPDKGNLIKVQASQIEVIDQKASLNAPAPKSADQTPGFEKPGVVGKVKNALTGQFDFEGAKLSEVSTEDMAKMPEGTILRAPNGNGSHLIKQEGDNWQHILSSGKPSGTIATSASVKNFDGFQHYNFAKKGSDPLATPNDSSSTQAKLPHPNYDLTDEELKQKYAVPENGPKPLLEVTKTSDGNTYIVAPEGSNLYTPAKELAVGDEVIAPDGAHPQKPFSMGKGWATKEAERVNTQGPKIGKVVSIKEHAYAVVQLPEGETVESVQKPGEQVNSVTIGLSNNVIKATPELKESLKDIIPEPKYAAPEAPQASDADAKKQKRLDLLKTVPAGSKVTAKDNSVEYTKQEDGSWAANDGSGSFISEKIAGFAEKSTVGFTMFAPTAEAVGEVLPESDVSAIDAAGPSFAHQLKEAPTSPYSLAGKDEVYGAFNGFNDAEIYGLKKYISTSMSANTALRKGGALDQESAKVISGLDSIINRSVLQEDAKVYRGVSADASIIDMFNKKGVMKDRAFVSTSVDKAFAEDWVSNTLSDQLAPVIMEINLPKGFKAHKIDYATVGTAFSNENEVILPRGLEFDITGVEEYTNPKGQKGYRVQATPILNEKNYDATGVKNDTGSATDAPAGTDTGQPAGNGTGQDGQVPVDSGSGGSSQPGGSPDASPAEPSPQATGDNGSSGPVDQPFEPVLPSSQPKQQAPEKAPADAPFEPVLPSSQPKQENTPAPPQEPAPAPAKPELKATPEWDQNGEWLKAVQDRYKANPNKAKATVEQSNNWGMVSKALHGDKNAVSQLLQSHYLDEKMYNDAISGIDAHTAKLQAEFPPPSGAKPGAKPLMGYTLEKNQNGVHVPTEKVSPSATMGLFNGDVYPTSLPFMLRDTNSGDTYYWDTTGVRRWGQYGAAGALTRRDDGKGGFEYLLAQRGANMSSGANKWALPGGAHKYASDAKANGLTAKTELHEELGLPIEGDPVANYKHQASPDWAYDYSIFDAPAGMEPNWDEVDKQEIQDLKWLSADEIKHMRDNGQLQDDMSKVIDDVLAASENVSKDDHSTTTPESSSNAPEAPSQAAEKVSNDAAPEQLTDQEISAKVEDAVKFGDGADPADVQAAKDALTKLFKDTQALDSQDSSATEPMPTVQTDGPSATMADGTQAYVGSRVTHDTFGHGTVVQIIAGKSAKIKFDDGIEKISQSHKINSHDKGAVKNSPADTSGMAPGEYANNPSSGKLFIVGSDNSAIYQGDKVEAMHQGEMRPGVVKGIYKSTNSVAIIFDGESKPSTKKASTVNSLEKVDAPSADAPKENTPDTTPADSSAPKFNEDGYTPEEAAQVAKLEEELAGAFKGTNDSNIDDIESQLDNLYAKGEARLKGENPDSAPADAPSANAPEENAPVADAPAEPAPTADSVSEPQAEAPKASEPAADEHPLDDNFEKLPSFTEYHKGDVAVLKDGKLGQWIGKGKLELEDGSKINGNKFAVDGKEIVVAGKDIQAVYRPKKMVVSSSSDHPFGEGFHGYSFDLSKPNNENFKPGDHVVYGKDNNEGKIMSVNPTNILVQKLNSDKNVPGTPTIVAGQIHGVYRKDGSATPAKDVADAPSAAPETSAPEADVTPAAPDNAPEAPATEAPAAPEAAPAASEAPNATNVPVGSYMPIGDSNSSFVKGEDGRWEMFINDYPTGVKSSDERVQQIADNTKGAFKIPEHLREDSQPAKDLKNAQEALKVLQEKIAKDLAEVDAKAKAAEEDAKAEAPVPSHPDNGVEEQLADWEKELLNGGKEDSPTPEQTAPTPEAAPAPAPAAPDNTIGSPEFVSSKGVTLQKPDHISQGLWDTYTPLEKENLGEVVQPLNPTEYLTSDGTTYYKPPTMSQSEWDSLAGWEKELTGHLVKPAPTNNYNTSSGVELTAPSGAILDDLNVGAKIVTSDKNEDVWTKTQEGATGYGDGIWTDQNGSTATSEEIANGADVKVTDFAHNETDEETDPVIAKFKESMSKLPTGAILGDPDGDNIRKIDDDLWYFYSGEQAVDAPAMSDMDTAEYASLYQDEFSPDTATLPDGHSAVSKVISYPEGTTIGDPQGGVYFVKQGDDDWKPMHSGQGALQTPVHATWVKNHTDQQIAGLSENSDEYSLDTVKKPDTSTGDSAIDSVKDDVAKLPIGAKLGNPDAQQFEKVAVNKWIDWFDGQKMATMEYSDADMASLVNEVSAYKLDSAVLPEGTSVATEEKTDVGTLAGLSKADFKKSGVGTKVTYSATGKASEPTGTYEKTGANEWKYTPEGSENPTKTGLTSDLFDHLFDTSVDNSQYSINNKRTHAAAPVEEPVNTTGVTKGVKVYSDGSLLEGYPVGTTLKAEKANSYYYPNNTYWVKQDDGNWQEFKKTNLKTMKGSKASSASLSYQLQHATVSEPTSVNNAVLGTGELAYAGDTIYNKGEAFTVKSITKTGINVVGSDGVKKLVKPHGFQKDSEFGIPQASNGSSNGYGTDPLSESSKVFKQAQQKKLEAKLEADKLTKDLTSFSGASADEYDAQGVTMKANPKPSVSNGLTVLESGEVPDKNSPWYGKPQPVKPNESFPAFQPPTAETLPKWDSADWLEKVKQRYLDNPNKAKASLEQSNNWNMVQTVLAGNKGELDNLLSSMYITPELKKEAEEGIAKQEKLNAPLKENIVEVAKAAKVEYDKKKAEHAASIAGDIAKYEKDLKDWMKANPSADAYKQAKKPPASTQNFEGGPADWTKAHVGTYTAKAVFDSMRDDNVLGSHGLSIATDSDQIEDLDVKVTKVLDSSGDPKFEVKFKLTAPHGKAFELALKNDSKVSANNSGIYPSHMVKDPDTGLLKDAGKPTASGFINSGTRYSYTDPMTGAKVVFQKSPGTGYNVSSNDNTVKIHMPIDSTPEMYQQTLENLGIKKARPSTQGDIKVLAENKLISLMGTHQGDVKTFDGRTNMSGADRKKALDKIAEDYGITTDDVTFSTEPNGRVKLFLSDDKAAELAKKWDVAYFKHNVSGGGDAKRWLSMLSGKSPGMLSTYHRFTEGIGGHGSSSSSDMANGAGDYNYITPEGPGHSPNNNVGIVLKPNAIFKRTDFWANPGDGWGKKAEGGSTSNKSPYKLFDSKGKIGYSGYGGGVYEVLPKDTIPLSDFAYVVVPNGVRADVLKGLQDQGILEINGFPIDKFVLAPGQTPPIDLTTAGSA